MNEKTCRKCGVCKPISEFHQRVRADRPSVYIRPDCKACEKARVLKAYYDNPERFKENAKIWQMSNRRKVLEIQRAWAKANKDRKAANTRASYDRNAEEIKKRERERYAANREEILAKRREMRRIKKENP